MARHPQLQANGADCIPEPMRAAFTRRRFLTSTAEGIDAHVTPEGDTVLTMVSDDNFSLIQRTLLLQFTLVE
jgi:hypothetical protein